MRGAGVSRVAVCATPDPKPKTRNPQPWTLHPECRRAKRAWYFIAEQPVPAPHLAHPAGCAALRTVLVTVPPLLREYSRMDSISNSDRRAKTSLMVRRGQHFSSDLRESWSHFSASLSLRGVTIPDFEPDFLWVDAFPKQIWFGLRLSWYIMGTQLVSNGD